MKIKDITNALELVAPLGYQESYDNSGLLVGKSDTEITKVLLCFDITEQSVEEARKKEAQLIIAHHPIIFGGLKRLNGNTTSERVVMQCLKHDIALYCAHTNIDNAGEGLNWELCQLLGIENPKVLSPISGNLQKLVYFTPENAHEKVLKAILETGAGHIGNYDWCSFSHTGTGSFRALEGTDPYVGKQGEWHKEAETRTEIVFQSHQKSSLLAALRATHPYEEVAFDIYPIANADAQFGAGMVGDLPMELPLEDFLAFVKERLDTGCIRYNANGKQKIKRVAVCGGSGAFLIQRALQAGADLYLTGDVKYHDFFDLEGKMTVADAGHYETEKHIINLFYKIIKNKFPSFAVDKTDLVSNPVNYF